MPDTVRIVRLSVRRKNSGGRLVSGWVRGAASEQFATNANPGYNREYFNEAHEIVVKAWTEPGPWRYEGKHFHYRFVDPWVLPLQKPHPPIWIPGLLSPETVIWCARHRYPYVALATFLEPTVELWNIYRDAAAKEGYQVGSDLSRGAADEYPAAGGRSPAGDSRDRPGTRARVALRENSGDAAAAVIRSRGIGGLTRPAGIASLVRSRKFGGTSRFAFIWFAPTVRNFPAA